MCAAVKMFQKNSSANSGTGEVFLTTKVTGKEHGTEKTTKAVEESVARAKEHGLVWVSKGFEFRLCEMSSGANLHYAFTGLVPPS